MTALGGDLYAARFRLKRLPEARLFLMSTTPAGHSEIHQWTGPEAPFLPTRKPHEGVVTVETLDSRSLLEGRRYSVYLPPGYSGDTTYPLVVIADGNGLEHFVQLFEPLVVDGTLQPFIAVGLWSGEAAIMGENKPDYDVRGADYLPGFPQGDDRFDKHLAFVADELLPAIAENYTVSDHPGDRVIAGKSNGGDFALVSALRRPDIFGNAIVVSRSWKQYAVSPQEPAPVRFLMSAGLYEPNFRETTQRAAGKLKQAGYDTVYTDYVGGHDPLVFDQALYDGLMRLLPKEMATE